jgi:hypothetical protein
MLTYVVGVARQSADTPSGVPEILALERLLERERTPVQSLGGISNPSVASEGPVFGGGGGVWQGSDVESGAQTSVLNWAVGSNAATSGLNWPELSNVAIPKSSTVFHVYLNLRWSADVSGLTRPKVEVAEPVAAEGPRWVAVVRDLVERDMILQARSLLDKVPPQVQADHQFVILKKALEVPAAAKSTMERIDRRREFDWLRAHEEEYRGKWVAVLEDQLISEARTLDELMREVRQRALPHRPLVHHFPA